MTAHRWDLVIFDNDGVLVDSEAMANRVLADLLSACGHPVTVDACVARFMGSSISEVRRAVESETGDPLPGDFEQRYHDELFASFDAGLRPVAGVVAVLDELERRGVPCCVASSGSRERIRLALSLVGLLDRFGADRIFSAEDVARGKPAPDLFLLAAGRLGVPPAMCLVVEDSPAGVAAARAAGMAVVGYAGMTPPDRLSGADAVVTSMAELLGVAFDQLPGRPEPGRVGDLVPCEGWPSPPIHPPGRAGAAPSTQLDPADRVSPPP